MTGLEKIIAVRNLVCEMCSCTGCVDCDFFNPEDATDGEYFCHLRDIENNVPYNEGWHMESAMVSVKKGGAE